MLNWTEDGEGGERDGKGKIEEWNKPIIQKQQTDTAAPPPIPIKNNSNNEQKQKKNQK